LALLFSRGYLIVIPAMRNIRGIAHKLRKAANAKAATAGGSLVT
jgi:hypothetical protein